ncbi:NADPH-dependent FMN reductase [Solicola gregarius]|uniref:NAD(P)H-dependent oxidoreductase n=1 Tax=Solicola gregarius TaxID=2908642 RepID=A0AA46TLL8_9ACTN|nr:NAD(P)H-dependent oxidoreductase [Solicola gregarius]UYM07536.1 NAD(P)H-dependent oxidoreductase [Solicola gregarius]
MADIALRVMTLCGNPRAGSRTFTLTQLVGEAIADSARGSGLGVRHTTIDLAAYSSALSTPASREIGDAVAEVRSSDVLIVSTPIYKGSYTGLLKSFLDVFPHRGLDSVTAVPVTVQASPAHVFAADLHLRPLLLDLGATTPTSALAVTEDQLEGAPDVVREWAIDQAPLAISAAQILNRTGVLA